MRFVDHQLGVVSPCQLQHVGGGRDIALHAEDALGKDDAGARTVCVPVAQQAFEKFRVAVRIDNFLRAREADAVDQTRMLERVEKNDVAGVEQRTEQTNVSSVTRAEKQGCFAARKERIPTRYLPIGVNCRKAAGTRGATQLRRSRRLSEPLP